MPIKRSYKKRSIKRRKRSAKRKSSKKRTLRKSHKSKRRAGGAKRAKRAGRKSRKSRRRCVLRAPKRAIKPVLPPPVPVEDFLDDVMLSPGGASGVSDAAPPSPHHFNDMGSTRRKLFGSEHSDN
eukprot:307383_1